MKPIVKKLIGIVIVAAILGGFVFLVKNWQPEEVEVEQVIAKRFDAEEAESVYTLENDKLVFALDPETTQFTVTMKDSGEVWRSNPEGIDSSAADSKEKEKLKSTLILSYSTQNIKDVKYDNYKYCIEKGLYTIEQGADYVQVNYSIGEVKREFIIPTVINADRFEQYLAGMADKDAKRCKEYYKKYDINKLGKKDNKEELLENYPILANEVCYVLRDVKDPIKASIEKFLESAGYTYDDFKADQENDTRETTQDKPVFNVSVIYKLEGGNLKVSVPYELMEYRQGYSISYLQVLPYMGAGTKNETGYLMVPEGGGALIAFNNGKISLPNYSADCYGWDMAVNRTSLVHETRADFNAFAILKENSSCLCILDEGSSYASIVADVSGKSGNQHCNYVSPIFQVAHKDVYEVTAIAGDSMYIFEENLADETLVLDYCFRNTSSYVDLADDYRDYLIAKSGEQLTLENKNETPLSVEIIGAVDRIEQVLGVPTSRPYRLTDIDETKELITKLYESGIRDADIKLSGYLNGGYKQQMLNSVKVVRKLGSKSDLKELAKLGADFGYTLFLDGITNYAYDSDLFDGFNYFTSPARFANKERAVLHPYSSVTWALWENEDTFYLLKPEIIMEMAQNLTDFAKETGLNVSFRDIGSVLSADYNKNGVVTRESCLNTQTDFVNSLSDRDLKVQVNNGNCYVAPYVDSITNMELSGSSYGILDESIPFYQMVLHGYVNYAGKPLNITANSDEELLHSAEYGAGLFFTLMEEDSMKLQNTRYTKFYAADASVWFDRVVTMYNDYNSKLGHTFNQKMTGHEKLSETLSCTSYEDGTKVYVNYSYDAVEVEGQVVPARDYIVIR